MHTPRYIYRERGEGIFKREDLRRALREAAVTSLQGSVWTRGRREGGGAWESISRCRTVSYTRAKAWRIPLLQYLSSAPREKSTSMREYSSRSRRPHFSFVRVAGFTAHFSGTGIRRPSPRENIIPPAKKRASHARGMRAQLHTLGFRQSAGLLRWIAVGASNGTLAPSETPGLLSSESALMVPWSPWRIPEDERPERAVSVETVCGEKLLYRLLEQATNSE